MRDDERYLFDVHGYLVVEDVLSAEEVSQLYTLLDEHRIWEQEGWKKDENFIASGEPHAWEPAFQQLITHPRLLPYLHELCGADLRYDHGHILAMRKGAGSLELHGGGTPFRWDSFYEVRDGRMLNGLTAVAISLVDASVDDGGFCCIPGSHKANYPCPREMLFFETTGPWLQRVPVRAGSAIIFTEALTHGTMPWTAEHERRAIFLKYTPGAVAYTGDYPAATTNENGELSALLQPPYAVKGDGLRAESVRKAALTA